MNRRRQAALSLAAAALAGLMVYGIYLLQLRQVRFQEMVEVIASREFVPAGATLRAEMLIRMPLPREAVTEEMIVDPAEAVGWETTVPLGSREPLLRWKLDRFGLLPRPGEATFRIPNEYIKAVSNGIRAGDLVAVYLSDVKGPSRRLFPEPVRVAAVKTAANVELDNPKNPNLLSLAEGDKEKMYASRRDANGTIDAINLNLTEEQWLLLDAACKDGSAKLVIAFDAFAPVFPEQDLQAKEGIAS
ncbi:MAG: flagellar biosynthesis protein FlgA [Paenibacillaceae bacterium ZCTH02-B3]|nr:MAG: flagellar biosynthesis protein FlgA [Paenibacillaceae bacterium ZCTH02-B3]